MRAWIVSLKFRVRDMVFKSLNILLLVPLGSAAQEYDQDSSEYEICV